MSAKRSSPYKVQVGAMIRTRRERKSEGFHLKQGTLGTVQRVLPQGVYVKFPGMSWLVLYHFDDIEVF